MSANLTIMPLSRNISCTSAEVENAVRLPGTLGDDALERPPAIARLL